MFKYVVKIYYTFDKNVLEISDFENELYMFNVDCVEEWVYYGIDKPFIPTYRASYDIEEDYLVFNYYCFSKSCKYIEEFKKMFNHKDMRIEDAGDITGINDCDIDFNTSKFKTKHYKSIYKIKETTESPI